MKRAAAEMMAAVPARGLTAAARQYRQDRRGELAPFCPVAPFGVARIRGGGEATGIYDHACVYAVDGPAEGLYAIRAGAHGRGAIMGLFAGTGHAEWLERLWPLPPGRWHRWDAEPPPATCWRPATAALTASRRRFPAPRSCRSESRRRIPAGGCSGGCSFLGARWLHRPVGAPVRRPGEALGKPGPLVADGRVQLLLSERPRALEVRSVEVVVPLSFVHVPHGTCTGLGWYPTGLCPWGVALALAAGRPVRRAKRNGSTRSAADGYDGKLKRRQAPIARRPRRGLTRSSGRTAAG